MESSVEALKTIKQEEQKIDKSLSKTEKNSLRNRFQVVDPSRDPSKLEDILSKSIKWTPYRSQNKVRQHAAKMAELSRISKENAHLKYKPELIKPTFARRDELTK